MNPQIAPTAHLPAPYNLIKSFVMFITPDMAANILETANLRDRPLSIYRVNKLVEELRNNRWIINTDAIGFDIDGHRNNGQHRLHAIVKANIGAWILIATNMPKNSFMTIDTHSSRKASDMSRIAGCGKHNKIIGTAISLLWRYNNNFLGVNYNMASNRDIFYLIQENPGINHAGLVGCKLKTIMSSGIAAFCYYIFSQINSSQADQFFESLLTGENLKLNSPILTLRNRLLLNKNSKSKLPQPEIVALVIKAWNNYRRHQTIKSLKWSSGGNERFPEAI